MLFGKIYGDDRSMSTKLHKKYETINNKKEERK